MGRGGIIVFVLLLVVGLGAGAWYFVSRPSTEIPASNVTEPISAPNPTPSSEVPNAGPSAAAPHRVSNLGTPYDPIIPKEGATVPFPPECVVPGPPPVMPRGEVASLDDMKVGHTAVQAFVVALEAYQACLEKHIKSDAATTPVQVRQIWRSAGNRAVDASNMLAEDYAEQYKLFKARQQPTPAPAH